MNNTIAFVCPWYGKKIPGGAERAVRDLVNNLRSRQLPVHVLTTCAQDFYHWDQVHKTGVETSDNGVKIFRFLQNPRNAGEFDRVNRSILEGNIVSAWDETVFLNNIIRSDELCRYIWKNRGKYTFVFTPYMFGTTYWCSQIVPDHSFIIPCLHDEPYLYLPRYRKNLQSAKGLLFYSEGEALLSRKILGESDSNQVIGLGIDNKPLPEPCSIKAFKKKNGLNAQFIFIPGRKQPEKNTDLLIDYYKHLKQQSKIDIQLVFAGPGNISIPDTFKKEIIDLGFISDSDLACAYNAAWIVCIPSSRESFSFTMFEAWTYKRPVLVHSDCMATALPTTKSRAGVCFSDQESFNKAILMFNQLSEENLKDMGQKGYNYTQQHNSWENVINRFVQALGIVQS